MSTGTVINEIEKVPIDARLLSDAIIELNISRRNVAIYPRDHPSVDRSLDRAFEFLQKLFEIRVQIVLAVAKDMLIIDDYYLDKKNPVYREFALCLSNLNIAYIELVSGLSRDEIYEFHHFISGRSREASVDDVREIFRGLNLIHIKAEFVDYGTFSFEDGRRERETSGEQLWERYIGCLLDGTLLGDEEADKIREIPPEMLARILNRSPDNDVKEETYDKVITTYIRRSAETVFSGEDLRRLLDFINGLKPELKKQFLSSTTRTFSTDIDSIYRSLKAVSVDEIIELLSVINEQKVAIPDSLKNLLDRLSGLSQNDHCDAAYEGNLLIDDIFLSTDIANLLGQSNAGEFVSSAYRKEIQKLLDFGASESPSLTVKDFEKEYSDEMIELNFNQTVLELIKSDIISEEECNSFAGIAREQVEQFIWTGRYRQILKTFEALESLAEENAFPDVAVNALQYYHSSDFISQLSESLRVVGRQVREEAWLLCEYYGEQIIPVLMDALVQEDNRTVRKFLLSLLKQFGREVIPETVKRLGDGRWYVKRNMLYILGELNREEVIPHVRSYCRHNNQKVRSEALKCLLSFGDRYGVEVLKDYLHSDSKEQVIQAVAMSGTFKVRETVDDLVALLRKKGISGSDLREKIPIVKALGDIGHAAAVEALRELLLIKSIIFKGLVEQLKEEIYRSLKNYPYESVQDLVQDGLKSKNDNVRKEALRLLKGTS